MQSKFESQRGFVSGIIRTLGVLFVNVLFANSAMALVDVGDDLHGEYDRCVEKFTAAKLRDEIDSLDADLKHILKVRRFETNLPDVHASKTEATNEAASQNGKGSNADLRWDVHEGAPFGPTGVAELICATLYHEMHHANEDFKGTKDVSACFYYADGKLVNSWLPVTEVEATRAENRFRAAIKRPLRMDYFSVRKNQWMSLPPPDQNCISGPWPKVAAGCTNTGGAAKAKASPCDDSPMPSEPDTAVPVCIVGRWKTHIVDLEGGANQKRLEVFQTFEANGSTQRSYDALLANEYGSASQTYQATGRIWFGDNSSQPYRYFVTKEVQVVKPGAHGYTTDRLLLGTEHDTSALTTRQYTWTHVLPKNDMYFECDSVGADNKRVRRAAISYGDIEIYERIAK